jgi:predicted lactoylglutathione lyase
MSTYFLRTTDNTSVLFHAATDQEARQMVARATKATGKSVQYVRRYDGTYGRSVG